MCEIGWRAGRGQRGGKVKYDQLGTLRYTSRNSSANQSCVRGIAQAQGVSPLERIRRHVSVDSRCETDRVNLVPRMLRGNLL